VYEEDEPVVTSSAVRGKDSKLSEAK